MMNRIPFQTTDWQHVPTTEHNGETGIARWKTLQYEGLRVRMVEYSANYKANHWCKKGHIVFCVEGEMISELDSGEKYVLRKGMSYQVSDDVSNHRTFTEHGATIFIIDGDFLALKS